MDVKRIIEKYDIEEYFDGGKERKIRLWAKPSEEDLEFVKIHKAEILAELDRIKVAEEEDRIHRHEVIICGWEASTHYVDDRKDLSKEIDRIFESCGSWTGCTREDIAEQVTRKLAIDAKKVEEEKAAEEEERKRQAEKEARKAKFEVIRTHEVQQCKGYDVDGYADVTIRCVANGEEIRVVERNIFDFGHYGYPYERKGTDAALDRKNWSELEREAVAWIEEFGPIKNKNMRM